MTGIKMVIAMRSNLWVGNDLFSRPIEFRLTHILNTAKQL